MNDVPTTDTNRLGNRNGTRILLVLRLSYVVERREEVEMSNITVGTQEYNVWLACEKGWKKAAGHIVTINGIDFSFVIHGMFNPKLLISGLTSGAKVVDVELFILEVINCDTKEKTLQMMHEYAVKLSEAIPDNFNERIQGLEKSALLSYVSEFGDMPEITPFVDKRLEEAE